MPLFGNKKKEKKKESNLPSGSLGNASSTSSQVTKVENATGNGLSLVTTTKIIQSSLSRTFTEMRREERSFFATDTLNLDSLNLHASHSDGNFGITDGVPNRGYRSAFSGKPFASYPSRTSNSPIKTSLFSEDGLRRTGTANANTPRLSSLSNVPRLSSPVVSNNVNRSNVNNNVLTQSAPMTTLSPTVPTYDHQAKKNGKVLIINNIKFLSDQNEERKGAEKDQVELKKLFRDDLKYDVEEYKNLSSREMNTKIKIFSKSSFKNYNISIVILMSHGTNRDAKGIAIKGGYTEIFGVDDVGVSIDEVLNYFSSGNATKELNGKPKIFINQCCRGNIDETVAFDSRPIKPVLKMHSDMLIAYSTLPGFYSNRDPVKGTWYIQSIVQTFREHHRKYHIEEMLKIVDDKLSREHLQYKQTSTYESRGFKICYLVKK